ncbi:hypothetical protein ACOZ38_28715 [Sphaerisporangium viridialbum]|uniref:hypothetical protein n=1 Tax=Sphaerisporangium viridialbum TaxID=46189 RepID=UPI003C73FB3D
MIYDAVGADLSQLPATMWEPLKNIRRKTVHYDGPDWVELQREVDEKYGKGLVVLEGFLTPVGS